MYNKNLAEKHLKKLLKHYKIKVIKWNVGANGRAYSMSKSIKIPKPTDCERFCIAMHEIKHIIDGREGRLFEREYACEIFAIEQAKSLGFDTSKYEKRARGYIIMNISKGHCRKLNLNSISDEIRDFCNINFEKWKGKKVFVSNWIKDLKISIT